MGKITSKNFFIWATFIIITGTVFLILLLAIREFSNIAFETSVSQSVLNPPPPQILICKPEDASPRCKKLICARAWNKFCRENKNPNTGKSYCQDLINHANYILEKTQVCVNGIPTSKDGCEFTADSLPECLGDKNNRQQIIDYIKKRKIAALLPFIFSKSCNQSDFLRLFFSLPTNVRNAIQNLLNFLNSPFGKALENFNNTNQGCLNCLYANICN